jgi:hypothetical protein
MTDRTDELIQRYLHGKTSRKEEKELLDILLKTTNEALIMAKKIKDEAR